MGAGGDAVLHHGAAHAVPEAADGGGDGRRGQVRHHAKGPRGDV